VAACIVPWSHPLSRFVVKASATAWWSVPFVVAGAIWGLYAMAAKITLLFEQGRSGWSETWYHPATDFVTAGRVLRDYGDIRAAMLGLGQRVGARITLLLTRPQTQVTLYEKVPTGADETFNLTPDSIKFQITASGQRRRTFLLRGVPDERIQKGVYVPDADYDRLINRWKNYVKDNLQLRTRTFTDVAPFAITSISGGGVVTSAAANLAAVGDLVTFPLTRDTSGLSLGGPYKVIDVIDTTHFQLQSWFAGRIVAGGGCKRMTLDTSAIIGIVRSGVGTRRTGRVFFLPKGRSRRMLHQRLAA